MNALFPGDAPEITIRKLRRLASDLARIRAGKGPTAAELNGIPVLDGWSVGARPVPCLIGSAQGHPLLGECRQIVTSEFFVIDPVRGWARTYSRFYALGAASHESEGNGHD